MNDHLLPLFDIPELPEHNGSKESFSSSNINHFITKVLPCTRETIRFLESSGDEFDQWVEEHRGDTDRSFFIEQLSVWHRELLPWMSMVTEADKCSALSDPCIHHGGTKERCVLTLPFMWASNQEAIDFVIKTCILWHKKKKLKEGKPQEVDGDFKISPNRADLIAEILVDAGWRFVVSGAYSRKGDGTLIKSEKGGHLLMWDYDNQRFIDALDPKSPPQVLLDVLNEIVAGSLADNLFDNLDRALVSRLKKRYGDSIYVVDSIPSYLVPISNGDYNVILQRLYPMSPFHAPKERIETPFEDWSDKEPPLLGIYGKTWDDLLDDWSMTPSGSIHRGRRLHLEQIAYQVLLGYNAFDSIFILSGDGSDGKSTFMNTLSSIIGPSRVSSANLNTLSSQSKDADEVVLNLGFKYAMLSSDADDSFTITNTAYLKSLSSGETISVVPKYRTVINTSFSGMLVQAMNGLPRFSESATLAMSRRLNYVLFENPQVLSQKKSANDSSLAEDLNRPSTRSYLLWRYLSGQSSAGLAYSGLASVDNRLALTRMGASDSAATFVQWLEDHGILDGETIQYLPKNTLRAVYGVYMDQEYDNQFPKSHKTFFSIVTNELAARGYVPDIDNKGKEKRYRTASFFARQGAPFLASLQRAGLSDSWIKDLSEPRSENFNYGETRAFVFKPHKVQRSYRPTPVVRQASFGRFFTSLGSQHAQYCKERGVDVNDMSHQPVMYDPAEHIDRVIPQEFVPKGMSDLVAGFLHDIPYMLLHMLSGDITRAYSASRRYVKVLHGHDCAYNNPDQKCLFPHSVADAVESMYGVLADDIGDPEVTQVRYPGFFERDMARVVPAFLDAYRRFMALDGFSRPDSLSSYVHQFCAENYLVFNFHHREFGHRFPRSLADQMFIQWMEKNEYSVENMTDDQVYSHLDTVFTQQGFDISKKKKLSAWNTSDSERIDTFPDDIKTLISETTIVTTKFYEKLQQ